MFHYLRSLSLYIYTCIFVFPYCQNIFYIYVCTYVDEVYFAFLKISLNTMESKIHSNLFFSGEVMILKDFCELSSLTIIYKLI